MKRFSLVAALACALVSGVSVQAGNVNLPTTLDKLDAAGATTTVPPLTFSNFSYYSATSLADSSIGVTALHRGIETGISFRAAFSAAKGDLNDYSITYTVSSSKLITDAYLGATGTSTGAWDVSETLYNHDTGATIGELHFSSSHVGNVTLINFAGVHSIDVVKDIAVGDSTAFSSVSVIDQGFSTAVPEPASMALLGIGLTGILAFRRRFKKASV